MERKSPRQTITETTETCNTENNSFYHKSSIYTTTSTETVSESHCTNGYVQIELRVIDNSEPIQQQYQSEV